MAQLKNLRQGISFRSTIVGGTTVIVKNPPTGCRFHRISNHVDRRFSMSKLSGPTFGAGIHVSHEKNNSYFPYLSIIQVV